MVLCLIALPIFLVLGIFSVKYRMLSRDAFECLGSTIMLKKCKSKLDERIKSDIVGRVVKRNARLGIFVYRNFQVISALFLMLLVLSLYFSVVGFINYERYGNCYGPGENDYFCPYSNIFGDKSCKSIDGCSNEFCNCDEGTKCDCYGGGCLD